MKPGKGQITINRKALEVYFPLEILQYQVKQPLLATNTAENYDIAINPMAVVSRDRPRPLVWASHALCEIDAEMRPVLKKAGFLTRDSREVERKPGQPVHAASSSSASVNTHDRNFGNARRRFSNHMDTYLYIGNFSF